MNSTKDEKQRYELVQKLVTHLNQNQTARTFPFASETERELAKPLNLLTLKPAIYVANLDEEQLKRSREVLKDFPHQPVIALSAQTESELIDLEESERNELLSSIGMNQPSLNLLAKTAFKTLKLMTFLTAGTLEARAWTIPEETLAPDAAGTIHTDFTKKFIKADIASFKDFIGNQGWQGCREKGLVRSEGKGYIMQEGDVVEFKIGA